MLLKDTYLEYLPGWRLTKNNDSCLPWYLIGENKVKEEDQSKTFQSAAFVAALILHDRLLLRLVAQERQSDAFELGPELVLYFIACAGYSCRMFCMRVRTDDESAQPGEPVRYSLDLLQSFNLTESADTHEFVKCLDTIHYFGATMHRESVMKDTAAAHLNLRSGQDILGDLGSMTFYHGQPGSITWKPNEDLSIAANWDGDESTIGSRTNSPNNGDENIEDMKGADPIEWLDDPEKPANSAHLTQQPDIPGEQCIEGARSSCLSDYHKKAECPVHSTGKPNISAMGRIFHGRKSGEKCETCRNLGQKCFNINLCPEAWRKSKCEILGLFNPPLPRPAV